MKIYDLPNMTKQAPSRPHLGDAEHPALAPLPRVSGRHKARSGGQSGARPFLQDELLFCLAVLILALLTSGWASSADGADLRLAAAAASRKGDSCPHVATERRIFRFGKAYCSNAGEQKPPLCLNSLAKHLRSHT